MLKTHVKKILKNQRVIEDQILWVDIGAVTQESDHPAENSPNAISCTPF